MTDPYLDRRDQMFPQLTAAQIRRISSVGELRRVRAGEVLAEVGEQDTRFFVVIDGSIEIVRPIAAGTSASPCSGPASSGARSTCSPLGAASCAAARSATDRSWSWIASTCTR